MEMAVTDDEIPEIKVPMRATISIEKQWDHATVERHSVAVAVNRTAFERAGSRAAKIKAARDVIASAMRAAREMCGSEVLATAYSVPVDERNEKSDLIELASRVSPLLHLFANLERSDDKHSIKSLMIDIVAVAYGDGTAIFGRRSNLQGSKSSFRQLLTSLRAVSWLAYLKARGVRPGVAQGLVADAYGVSTRTVTEEWQARAVERLPAEIVSFVLDDARGMKGYFAQFNDLPQAALEQALEADGKMHGASGEASPG